MKKLSLTFSACFLILGGVLVPRIRADQWNQMTYVTFNQPVEIPGRVLSAGTYMFKLLDSQSDRDIVQVFNKQGTELYATVLAIPDVRLEPTGKSVITFEERAAKAPEALKAWFYPGDTYGQEFVYPKVAAVRLASVSHESVPSMPTEMAQNISKPAKTGNEPSVVAMKKAPLKAEKPSGEEVEVAQEFKAPAKKSQPKTTEMAQAEPAPSTPAKLPQTASPMPLIALLGLLSLGTGITVRFAAARIR
jgi:hypothetical protein